MHSPGWYHAEGDPPGTTRYWDGSTWVGGASREQDRQTGLGYELIPIEDVAPAQPHIETRTVAPQNHARKIVSADPVERFASIGLLTLGFGILLGIAIHNIVTLFPEPATTTGEIIEVREVQARRGGTRLNIELQSPEGRFHSDARASELPAVFGGQTVEIEYSETTGGLVAIPALEQNRRLFGRFLWPAVGLISIFVGGVRWRFDQLRHGGNLSVLFLLMLLVIGPVLGYFVVTGFLDEVITTLL